MAGRETVPILEHNLGLTPDRWSAFLDRLKKWNGAAVVGDPHQALAGNETGRTIDELPASIFNCTPPPSAQVLNEARCPTFCHSERPN